MHTAHSVYLLYPKRLKNKPPGIPIALTDFVKKALMIKGFF